MDPVMLELPNDPSAAVALLHESSRTTSVLVFKKSPICPVSVAAERALNHYLGQRHAGVPLQVATVDVIAERGLARGLTSELGIRHESPQALLFVNGALQWHGSHGDLTPDRFAAEIERQEAPE